MSKIIQCPACATKLKLGEASAKKTVIACPACAQKIRVRPDNESVARPAKKAAPRSKRDAPERPVRESRPRAESSPRSESRSRSEGREDRRSRDSTRRPPRSGRKSPTRPSKSGNNRSPILIGLMGAGAAIGVIAVIGGIWWWMNSADADENGGGESVANFDPANSVTAESTGGTNSTNADPAANNPSAAPSPQPTNTNPPIPAPSTPGDNPSFAVKPPNNNTPPTNPQPQPRSQQPRIATQPVMAEANSEVLRYGWTAGDTHIYNYELDAEIDGKLQHYPGSVTLSVRAGQNKARDETTSGTGTGFVITPDGYMLTCHHVTNGATSIQVALSGRTYPGRVIASSRKHDLSVVKIDAQNLPTVPLANSDSVQLAEEVRAIGYPLTTLLGQGIKVTRGTISGINMESDGKRFQIDAAINPGNSGGPLFNGRGQVIGINSAKLLAGSSISSIGFSVPVNHAKALLQQHGIAFTAKNGGATLTGPALVNQVRPAIALLTVESRSRAFEQFVLSYSGGYTSPSSSSGGARRGRISIPRGPIPFTSNRTSSRGKVILNVFGEVEDYEDTAQLPFTTGSMAMLMIHQLDPDGAKSWSHETQFQLTKPKPQANAGPFGMGGPRFRGGPFGQPQQREPDEVLMDGIEIYRYQILSSNDKEVKISKDYELRTLDHPTNPYTLITGKGTITFDKAMALPRTMEYKQTFQHNSENISVKIPITIKYRMQDPAILAKAQRDAEAKAAEEKAQKEAQAAAEAAMSPEERLDFFIAEIKAKRGDPVYAKLAAMDVIDSRRKQVSDLLLPGLSGRRPNSNLLTALGKWATPKVVTAMIAKLESMGDNDWPAGRSMIAGLAGTGDERVIEPIAERFKARAHPWHDSAKAGLIKFGPKAEDAVLAILIEAPTAKICEVLGMIGTKKSTDALQKLLAHKDFWVKKAAGEALGKIVSREG